MSPGPATQVLLGPQRPESNLGTAIERLALADGPVAVISAGWQEAEGDLDVVGEIVGRPLRELGLYRRTEAIFESHADFHAAYRDRQERLKEQQRLYQLRLKHLINAARLIMRSDGDPRILAPEQRHAIAQLRALDRHHLLRVESVHAEFAATLAPGIAATLDEHRDEIAATINECAAVVITGGNVIVLLNRLLLFGLGPLLREQTIIAWSAGAMVLGHRIVLFHDRTPEGRRDPELLGAGLGLVGGYLFLPDSKRRIYKKDPVRMGLFCRRFAPEECALLDVGSLLRFDDGQLADAVDARRIKPNGSIGPVPLR